jgi:phosphonate transport system ATP-binding protein
MTSGLKPSQDRQNPASQSIPAIVLDEVRVRYTAAGPHVLDIDRLVIAPGERIALIGPSGAAKTTLLRLINGYVRSESGQVTVLGQNVSQSGASPRRVGFIFQEFNLVERATVFQNVLWGRLGRVNPLLSLFNWFPRADKRLAMQAIAEVDLVEQAKQRADTLSGGQKQRVAVARVLAQGAEIILADEPVSNLDPALADDILSLLVEVTRHHGVTLVMSVHQPALAKRYADRIIGLRQGRVVFDGSNDDLTRPILTSIYGRQVDLGSELAIERDDQNFIPDHRPILERTEQELSV